MSVQQPSFVPYSNFLTLIFFIYLSSSFDDPRIFLDVGVDQRVILKVWVSLEFTDMAAHAGGVRYMGPKKEFRYIRAFRQKCLKIRFKMLLRMYSILIYRRVQLLFTRCNCQKYCILNISKRRDSYNFTVL